MAPFTHISVCVSFFGKMSRLTLYLKTKLYHLIIHVFGKVQDIPKPGICTMSMFKTFLQITNSTWFT